MKRGLICWVNLEDATPPEFGKLRPALIISNSTQNAALPTAVVIPISSKSPEIWPLRLEFKMPVSAKVSYLVVPGIRQVSKERLQKQIGTLSPFVMGRVEEAVMAYLSDD